MCCIWSSIQYSLSAYHKAKECKLNACVQTRETPHPPSIQFASKSARFGFLPGKWDKTSKETDKKRRAFLKIAQIAHGHTHNASATSPLSSLRKSDRQEDKLSKTERQTIDRTRYGCSSAAVYTYKNCSKLFPENCRSRRDLLVVPVPPIRLHNTTPEDVQTWKSLTMLLALAVLGQISKIRNGTLGMCSQCSLKAFGKSWIMRGGRNHVV